MNGQVLSGKTNNTRWEGDISQMQNYSWGILQGDRESTIKLAWNFIDRNQ